MFLITSILTATAIIGRCAKAQASNNGSGAIAVCTVTATGWTFNEKGQSPCEVANTLVGQCLREQGPFVTQLQSGNVYQNPGVSTQCSCSSVTYSLISACAICQGQDVSSWAGVTPSWTSNCPANLVTNGRYPSDIPSNISIPVWAYQNISEIFNPLEAAGVAAEHLPDSTLIPTSSTAVKMSTTSAIKTPLLTSTSSPTSSSASGSPMTTSSTSKSNTGTIIAATAGVLGGLLLLLILFAIYRFHQYKRRRDPKRYFEGMYQTAEREEDPPYMPSESTILAAQYTPYKLYDPADPSTYPPNPFPVLPLSPASPTSVVTSTTSTPSRHTRQTSSESDSSFSTRSRTSRTHSRQTSTDTTSAKSLVSPVTSNSSYSRNFNSGYRPSGIVYRTV